MICKDLNGEGVKTGFTLEVTLRKSGVESDWDLASPYVVHPCLHTQWSHILERSEERRVGKECA